MFSNTVQHNEEERKDTILATESYAGDGDGIDPIPSVIKMDCAMELINGCLAGYRSCHHVTTGQLYNNVVIFILLQHDFLMLNIVDGSEAKIVSKNTYARILALSPCIFKQCKSHLWRAVKNYRRHKSSPPTEFRLHSESFDRIFELIAKEMTIIRSISELIVRMSIFVALFETEYLPCRHFHLNSAKHTHHNTKVSEMTAANMDRVATEEMKRMLMMTEEMMESFIQREMADGQEDKHTTFKGHIIARSVINRMKQEINFGVPYLKSVDHDTKMGKVQILCAPFNQRCS